MTNKFRNLTEYEIGALESKINLADAHAHQSQSNYHKEIIEHLPEIWFESENNTQAHFENLFLQTFFTTQNQSIALSLPDLLKNQKVKLSAFPERILYKNVYNNLQRNIKTDGIFLLDPVNPTGYSISSKEENLRELLSFCRDFNKILILDLCFAPFFNANKDDGRVDIYQLLEEYNIEYICIEDTGKFFATQDMKCSILTTSLNLFEDLYKIQTDVLLNVSPFTLNFLSKYIKISAENSYYHTRNLLQTNLDLLIHSFKDLPIKIHKASVLTSVAWIEVIDNDLDFKLLMDNLREENIYVLPGNFFFWNTSNLETFFFRIAMARDADYFKASIQQICKQIRNFYD